MKLSVQLGDSFLNWGKNIFFVCLHYRTLTHRDYSRLFDKRSSSMIALGKLFEDGKRPGICGWKEILCEMKLPVVLILVAFSGCSSVTH